MELGRLKSNGFSIDLTARSVINPQGEACKIRNKTFEMLSFLLRNPDRIISKAELLRHIWDDVAVGEQVIFQSVKDIRRMFGQADVIKTFPRKGYQWGCQIEALPETQNPAVKSNAWIRPAWLLGIGSMLLVGLLWFFTPSSSVAMSGSVIVLPVTNKVEGNDHRWVRLGMMDQMIQRLSPNDDTGILAADYVLQILARTGIKDKTIDQAAVKQIFRGSGANLIIASELVGHAGDYRLVYVLYQRNTIQRGVILGSTIRALVDDFSVQIGQRWDIVSDRKVKNDNKSVDYSSHFANELVANALSQLMNGNKQAAQSLLLAALSTAPNNITARRLLIQQYVETQQWQLAQQQLDIVTPILQTQSQPEESLKIAFWRLLLALSQGQIDSVEESLTWLKNTASAQQDWLMLAYIFEIEGQYFKASQDLVRATKAYDKALVHHQILQCPYGQSNVLIARAAVNVLSGNKQQALADLDAAAHLISSRQLDTLQPKLKQQQSALKVKGAIY